MSTIEQIRTGEWFQRDMVQEESVILNKQLLTDEQLEFLLQVFSESPKDGNDLDNKINVSATIPHNFIEDWTKKMQGYIPIQKISNNATIKKYKFGGMKEHSDVHYYDEDLKTNSTYTLLIYLTDSDSGETAIKRKKFRSIDNDATKKHERIFCTPTKGHCVVFNSKLKHYANDDYNGKIILHTRIY